METFNPKTKRIHYLKLRKKYKTSDAALITGKAKFPSVDGRGRPTDTMLSLHSRNIAITRD
jgi:hypothetical protein